tara:strand:+ start:73 stop:285 length:213 start_codon:yes stop_codon:yes gene_type:complete
MRKKRRKPRHKDLQKKKDLELPVASVTINIYQQHLDWFAYGDLDYMCSSIEKHIEKNMSIEVGGIITTIY